MDEKDLIRKAKKGDTLALSKLLQQNYSFLVNYLMKVTLHPQIAEDLTQETMMKCIEIRTALSKAGMKPPYVLMPHSASGIYSEYYAAKYPDEVSAIIMLDTTPTVKMESNLQTFIMDPKTVKIIYGFNTLLTGIS